MKVPDQAATTAEGTLSDRCVIARPGAGEWTPTGGLPDVWAEVWRGPCALSGPNATTTGKRSEFGGADRLVAVEIVRVPRSDRGGPSVLPGDRVTINGDTGHTYQVIADRRRTTSVLQRIRVVSTLDESGVAK